MSLSIVTAIHNGLPMNRLYWDALCHSTTSPFELILIDNHSTDGSEKFFQQIALSTPDPNRRLVYVRNERNRNYPLSQIQGMEHARFDHLVFLNNDTWMPRGWNEPIEGALETQPLGVVSPSGQEAQATQQRSDLLKNRWRWAMRLSRAWAVVWRKSEEERLRRALHWMYGDLKSFASPTPPGPSWNGIKGDCVAFHRQFLTRVPDPWDPRVEAADWHLYLKVASLHELEPDIPLPRILPASYVHHFGRYSARLKFEPMERPAESRTIEQVWGPRTVERLWWGNRLPVG